MLAMLLVQFENLYLRVRLAYGRVEPHQFACSVSMLL